jgi:hypothetical protein
VGLQIFEPENYEKKFMTDKHYVGRADKSLCKKTFFKRISNVGGKNVQFAGKLCVVLLPGIASATPTAGISVLKF